MYTSRTPNDMAARIYIFICCGRLIKVIGMPMNIWAVYLKINESCYRRLIYWHIIYKLKSCHIRKASLMTNLRYDSSPWYVCVNLSKLIKRQLFTTRMDTMTMKLSVINVLFIIQILVHNIILHSVVFLTSHSTCICDSMSVGNSICSDSENGSEYEESILHMNLFCNIFWKMCSR